MTGDPMAPIAGVSLEKYAELVVKTRGSGRDACATIVEANGVSGAAWERAMAGWEVRLASDATPGYVTVAYYDYYRQALVRHTRPPSIVRLAAR